MSVEISVNRKSEGGCSIWMDDDAGYRKEDFLEHISALSVEKTEMIHQCFGPAEYIHEVHTAHGRFIIHRTFDGWAGITISSPDAQLMDRVLQEMLDSGAYSTGSES